MLSVIVRKFFSTPVSQTSQPDSGGIKTSTSVPGEVISI